MVTVVTMGTLRRVVDEGDGGRGDWWHDAEGDCGDVHGGVAGDGMVTVR